MTAHLADVSPGLAPDGSTALLLANDPWWLMVIKAIVVFAMLLLLTLFAIWFERRVVGRMQHRPGPNWNGPFGLLQSLADALKLIFKEGIIPARASRFVFKAAPVMACIPAFLTFSIIPVGGEVSFFGHHTALQLVDLPVGVLAALAFAGLGVYGIVLGGWASGSTYPMLGGLRSAAQLISYEVAMGLSFVAVFLYSGSSVHLGDRHAPGGRLVFLDAARLVPRLLRVDGRRDEPGAVRHGGGRGRAGRRVQHGVLRHAVRDLLPGRVHQHDQRQCHRHDAVPRRLAGPGADLPDPGSEFRLVAGPLVLDQGPAVPVRLHLDPRRAPSRPLRPVHAPGLEGPGPDLAGLDRPHCGDPGPHPGHRRLHRQGRAVGRHPAGDHSADRGVLARPGETGGRLHARGVRRLRRPVIDQPPAAGAVVAPRLGAYPVPSLDLVVPIPPIRTLQARGQAGAASGSRSPSGKAGRSPEALDSSKTGSR